MTRINTNVPSIRAIHQLGTNQRDLEIRLHRLATGLRINSGRDDPAGLIASESLRSEIRGIQQAIENSTRAINVIATAEGALQEVSALLLEIRELITHSANEGALSEDEINANQLQIDSLLESIDRIANTTQFAGQKLLNGSYEYTVSGVNSSHLDKVTIYGASLGDGSGLPVTIEVTDSAELAQLTFAASGLGSDNVTIEVQGTKGTQVFSFAGSTHVSAMAMAINSFSHLTGVSATVTAGYSALVLNSTSYGSDAFVSVQVIDGTFTLEDPDGNTATRDTGQDASVLINGQSATVDGLTASIRGGGLDLVVTLSSSFGTTLGTTSFWVTGGGARFQLGPEVNASGQLHIGIPAVSTSHLGGAVTGYLASIRTGGANSIVSGNYTQAEEIVKAASNQVAVLRGRLGGIQRNQIETNINSPQVAL